MFISNQILSEMKFDATDRRCGIFSKIFVYFGTIFVFFSTIFVKNLG